MGGGARDLRGRMGGLALLLVVVMVVSGQAGWGARRKTGDP